MKSVFSIFKSATIFFVLSRTKSLSETAKQYVLDEKFFKLWYKENNFLRNLLSLQKSVIVDSN